MPRFERKVKSQKSQAVRRNDTAAKRVVVAGDIREADGARGGTVTGAGKASRNAGLRRSIETTTSLLFFRILNVFGPSSRTGKGPS